MSCWFLLHIAKDSRFRAHPDTSVLLFSDIVKNENYAKVCHVMLFMSIKLPHSSFTP